GDDVDRARRLFIKDEFLGSYYELSYYLSSKDEEPKLKDSYETMWGNAFAAHAYYINRTDGKNAKNSIALANYMEAMNPLVIRNGTAKPILQNNDQGQGQQSSAESQYGLIILLMIVILALMYIIYRVMKVNRGKSYGSRQKDG
ncbi:MAG: hypothetical protein NTY68_02375, partial [Candidatus Micrarchaeota archaeon]|nr:hypothetical protein [Candidatus Micrarchaeota archaeon]